MFGYVRPLRGELKCRDMDLYQAAYCGLCHTLRRRFGLGATLFLNYDFTLLALLLPTEENFSRCRCPARPLHRKRILALSPALETAADESIILSYWKLRDAAQDERGLRGLGARMLSWFLFPVYRKASRLRPAFDRAVRGCLGELSQLEGEECPSMDRTADTFARLLQAAVPETGEPGWDRAMGQLLYHLGRWIYLIDARDDLEEDRRRGRYNPLLLRYGEQCDDEALGLTLERSLDLASSALPLLEFGSAAPVVENVFLLGLPAVQRSVFQGTWGKQKRQQYPDS